MLDPHHSRQVIDEAHLLYDPLHQGLVEDTVIDEVKALVPQEVADVIYLPCGEIINHVYLVALGHQDVCQMRADVARPTGDEYFHSSAPPSSPFGFSSKSRSPDTKVMMPLNPSSALRASSSVNTS